MKCHHCQADLPDTAKFCASCGQTVELNKQIEPVDGVSKSPPPTAKPAMQPLRPMKAHQPMPAAVPRPTPSQPKKVANPGGGARAFNPNPPVNSAAGNGQPQMRQDTLKSETLGTGATGGLFAKHRNKILIGLALAAAIIGFWPKQKTDTFSGSPDSNDSSSSSAFSSSPQTQPPSRSSSPPATSPQTQPAAEITQNQLFNEASGLYQYLNANSWSQANLQAFSTSDHLRVYVYLMLIVSEGSSATTISDYNKFLSFISSNIVALQPSHKKLAAARALNDQALQLIKGEDLEAADGLLNQAVRMDPLDVEIVNNLAFVQMKLGRYQPAVANLITSLSLAPDRASAWSNLGDTYALMGNVDQALAAYENTFVFSKNPAKTQQSLIKEIATEENPQLRSARQAAVDWYSSSTP